MTAERERPRGSKGPSNKGRWIVEAGRDEAGSRRATYVDGAHVDEGPWVRGSAEGAHRGERREGGGATMRPVPHLDARKGHVRRLDASGRRPSEGRSNVNDDEGPHRSGPR